MKCIAEYNKLVKVEKVTATTLDAAGHVDKTAAASWATYGTAWCAVQSKGGREFWKVDLVAADVSHVWRTQYTTEAAAITPQMRIVWESKTYEVLSVIDIDLAHEEIEIQTRREL